MKKEIADRWIELLESGLGQTRSALKRYHLDAPRYCCLGVLCELAVQDGIVEERLVSSAPKIAKFGAVDNPGDESVIVLPAAVMKWAGIATDIGEFDAGERVRQNLANLNDSGQSFREIAEVIRQHWAEL